MPGFFVAQATRHLLFGCFLDLGFNHRSINQLDVGHRCLVAGAVAALQDTQVTTGTLLVARAEQDHFRIKRFAVLYKLLDMDDGELTKTGKIRRKFVREKYQNLYDALYDESISEKEVEAFFQYQDGQSTKVKTKISFYTMEGF